MLFLCVRRRAWAVRGPRPGQPARVSLAKPTASHPWLFQPRSAERGRRRGARGARAAGQGSAAVASAAADLPRPRPHWPTARLDGQQLVDCYPRPSPQLRPTGTHATHLKNLKLNNESLFYLSTLIAKKQLNIFLLSFYYNLGTSLRQNHKNGGNGD